MCFLILCFNAPFTVERRNRAELCWWPCFSDARQSCFNSIELFTLFHFNLNYILYQTYKISITDVFAEKQPITHCCGKAALSLFCHCDQCDIDLINILRKNIKIPEWSLNKEGRKPSESGGKVST